jgi:hypothetical protein
MTGLQHSFKKYILPGFFSAIAVDSWLIARNQQRKDRVYSLLQSEIDKLQKDSYCTGISNQDKINELIAKSGRINEAQKEMEGINNKAKYILEQLNKSNLDSSQHKELTNKLNSLSERQTDLVKKMGDEFKDISDSTSKNDIFDSFIQLINEYKEFLSTLSVEHLACLTNLIGFSTIFIVLNSIFLTYFGDKIINYFNLEIKLPKLSKFIQIRRKFLNKYIKFQIIYVYIVSIIFIGINTYMFFM